MSKYYVMKFNAEDDQIEQLSVPFTDEESAQHYMKLCSNTYTTRLYVMEVKATVVSTSRHGG